MMFFYLKSIFYHIYVTLLFFDDNQVFLISNYVFLFAFIYI